MFLKAVWSKSVSILLCGFVFFSAHHHQALAQDTPAATWNQWRGPTRDGQVPGSDWPTSLSEDSLKLLWRVKLDASYSGPIVSQSAIYVTGTANKKMEVVTSLDRKTGRELWKAEWPGSLSVPFFAASNGSWIRSTPVLDEGRLFVAGIRDVVVALDAKTGKELWRLDFVKDLQTTVPTFGFVSSPLVDGEFLYVQAGASIAKLEKATGKLVWRALQEKGGMMSSAFSSPIIATLQNQRQLVVQTRQKLVGIDLENGSVFWEQTVPSFRGMNILTPVVFQDAIFTSSYQNKSWLYSVGRSSEKFRVQEVWNNNAQGYMSTPILVGKHAYLHLQNQRFTCIDLETGTRTWTSQPFGKYCSMIAQGNRILGLDQRGDLLLLNANPEKFELIDQRKVSDEETWAHLAVCNDELFVRELNALSVFRWSKKED